MEKFSRLNIIFFSIVILTLQRHCSSQPIDKRYYGCDPKSAVECNVDHCQNAIPCSNNTNIECHNNLCTCSAVWWIGEKVFDCNSAEAFAPRDREVKKSGIIPANPLGLDDYQLYYGCASPDDVVTCNWEVCDERDALISNKVGGAKANGGLETGNAGACPGYPGATPYPNACFKCSCFWWFWGLPVDCNEEHGQLKKLNAFDGLNDKGCDGYSCNCDPKLPEVTCFHDPCINATCSIKDAECRSNNCFQCEARFYIGSEEQKCVD